MFIDISEIKDPPLEEEKDTTTKSIKVDEVMSENEIAFLHQTPEDSQQSSVYNNNNNTHRLSNWLRLRVPIDISIALS